MVWMLVTKVQEQGNHLPHIALVGLTGAIKRGTSPPSHTPKIINRCIHVISTWKTAKGKPTTAQRSFLQITTKVGTSFIEKRATKTRENFTLQLLTSTFVGGNGVVTRVRAVCFH